MLDTFSLRVAIAFVTLLLLVLFYAVTFRTTRSRFAALWCVSLGLQGASAVVFLLVGTQHQVWANPLGAVLNVLGMGSVWAASRSLRNRPMPWWWLTAAPLVVGVMAVQDDPGDNVWPAGGFFLAAIWIQMGLATMELWRLARAAHLTESPEGRAYRHSVWSLVCVSGVIALFYLGRWIALLVVGQDRAPFTTVFGSAVTTVMLIGLLTTVAFNMSIMSDEQQKEALRELAARDGLTGLLNRTGFLQHAEEELARGGGGQVILADLDHFKKINDEHGHAAGDRAIVSFAEVCTASVRSSDLVGRYGGEEFILLLPGATRARAVGVTRTIAAAMATRAREPALHLPTVSFGISEVVEPLSLSIEWADQALYRAKDTGRDRSVHHADLA